MFLYYWGGLSLDDPGGWTAWDIGLFPQTGQCPCSQTHVGHTAFLVGTILMHVIFPSDWWGQWGCQSGGVSCLQSSVNLPSHSRLFFCNEMKKGRSLQWWWWVYEFCFAFIKWIYHLHSDGIQDIQPQNMACWPIEYFKVKELEKWHVQKQLSDLLLKKVITLIWEVPSLYLGERSTLTHICLKMRDIERNLNKQIPQLTLHVPHTVYPIVSFHDLPLFIKSSIKARKIM